MTMPMIEHMEDGSKLFTVTTSSTPIAEIGEVPEDSIAIEQDVPFFTQTDHLDGARLPLSYVQGWLAAGFSSQVDNPYFKPPTAQDLRNGAVPYMFSMYGPYYLATNQSPMAVEYTVATKGEEYLKRLDIATGDDGASGALLGVLKSGRLGSGPQRRNNINLLRGAGRFLGGMANIEQGPYYNEALRYRSATRRKIDGFTDTLRLRQSNQSVVEGFLLPASVDREPSNILAHTKITVAMDDFPTFGLRRGALFAALAAEKVGNPLVRATILDNPYGF